MSQLVEALVSLIRTKTEEFEIENVSLVDTLQKITDQLKEIHQEADIKIIYEEDVVLKANKQYIWAICRNICENALKHGSDEVQIYIDEKTLKIQDNGI